MQFIIYLLLRFSWAENEENWENLEEIQKYTGFIDTKWITMHLEYIFDYIFIWEIGWEMLL